MISKLKNLIAVFALTFAFGAPFAVTASAGAQDIQGGLNCGVELNVESTTCATPTTGASGLQSVLAKAINIFSLIVGVIAVIMIIVGGLKYITSGGDSSNVSGAKNTIIYALVGLVIVALAQFIVRFVLNTSNSVV